ncbi:hypothetical protein E2C01_011076 [Portunus trituberculatus]|uniref:Uncharacterized protein n=1 Tax=Portunus trituberculatus TaxID=210409 RepID=A0A5B7DAH3_PORTR|nr:hypothetical protein [Portunus trituberculatus]
MKWVGRGVRAGTHARLDVRHALSPPLPRTKLEKNTTILVSCATFGLEIMRAVRTFKQTQMCCLVPAGCTLTHFIGGYA